MLRAMGTRLTVWLFALALMLLATLCAHAQGTQVPQQAQRWRAELTRAAHVQWGLDAPIAALAAQLHQESGWNPQAVSRAGAVGMAQFMPATTSWWCGLSRLNAAQCQPTNAVWAMRALVGYDRWLYERAPQRYGLRDRMWVTLRAYNGGLGHWQAEAASSGLAEPTRAQVDAMCGHGRRAAVHCAENLGYPHRILVVLQPLYLTWGAGA